MALNPRQIEVIYAVLSTGSVTDAAGLLGVSQPAISMTLRECNQVAGFPLFERRQGRLQPTEETLIMAPDLGRIVSDIQKVSQLVSDLRDSTIGYVKLVAAPSLANTIVPLALAAFRKERERVRLSLISANADQIAEEVENDRVDLGLGLASGRSTSDFVLDIGLTHLVCVLPVGHELAKHDALGPSELAKFSIITFARSMPSSDIVDEFFRRAHVPYSVACEVSNTSTVCALVEQNIGIALVPKIGFMTQSRRNIVGVPLRPVMSEVVQIYLPKRRRPSRTARRLIATIRSVARNLLDPLPKSDGHPVNA